MSPDRPGVGGTPVGAPGDVSLQAMIARQVALEWYQCVAIVAELGSGLPDTDPPSIPTAQDVLVTAAGAIVVRAGAQGDGGIIALPRLLNALLDGSSPPAPVRLFVVHAISSNSHRSIRSFTNALAYYERPGRTELIQSAYQRYFETPECAPEPPQISVQTHRDGPEQPNPPSRRVRLWIPVAATLVCSTILALAMTGPRWARSGSPVGLLVSQIGDAARTVAQSLRESLGGDVSPVETVEAIAPPVDRAIRPRRPATQAVDTTQGDVRDRDAAPAVRTALSPATTSPAKPARVDWRDASPGSGGAEDTIIYSDNAPDVEPAVLVDPERLPDAVHATNGIDAGNMELIISETGVVSGARFLSPPARMTDVMLLSAAKTWIFQPAKKDGRPVQSRVVLNASPLR